MLEFRGESTPGQIQARFDQDVERFSNLETGQSATIDAPVALELATQAASSINPAAERLLDLGCGAGNFSLRFLQTCKSIKQMTLVDLSRPMLDRAQERIQQVTSANIRTLQGDLRTVPFEDQQYDVIFAGAVLHHLRTPEEWSKTFQRLYQATAPGGSLWIFDLITFSHPRILEMMSSRYGEYLTQLKGPEYRRQVFEYIAVEDTPRTLVEQLDWLRQAGFQSVEVLHANTCFAAFGGIRSLNS